MFDLKAIARLFLLPGVLSIFLVKVVSGFPSGECPAHVPFFFPRRETPNTTQRTPAAPCPTPS